MPASPSRIRISREVARRFLLGRTGLWPGRRWRAPRGTEAAMRAMEELQLDPLRIVARAQDLALQARVLDYREGDWTIPTHERRRFFEYGGWLAVRPMAELPLYRVVMRRSREFGWAAGMAPGLEPAIEEMRQVLAERREVGNRDFAIADRTRVDHYRGRKDSSVALHYLWRVGEAMVARRTPAFERVYARPELVAPRALLREAPDAEADDALLRKAVRAAGFSKLTGARWILFREIPAAELAAWRARRLADGTLVEVEIEGLRGPHLATAAELPELEALAAGRTPRTWRPTGLTTADEVTFLSPLDPVVANRERTRRLFDFDYKWEVYEPLHRRKYGYYVLPILWGDELVARADLRFDRPTGTLQVLGLWFEPGMEGRAGLGPAMDRGFERLTAFLRGGVADATRRS